MVPHRTPAPSAARMPSVALPDVSEDWCEVAYAITHAPTTMAAAPPNTFDHPFTPDPRNSLNSSQPQKRPTRLLVFHSGKAMESPTLRIANTVKVLATAQSIPASTAHTIRWAFSRKSSSRKPVPFSAMGTVQRATNTPATMPSEMTKGEKPMVTNLVGASAAPSQAPAANPQTTPSLCRERDDRPLESVELPLTNSPQHHQQGRSQNQYGHRHPEMDVGEYGDQRRLFQGLTSGAQRAAPAAGKGS